jgi:U3 small nucleolar RNA-associated protein 20
VTVCYAKTIRKLSPQKFHNKLNKLINLIVVNGLRSKDLSHREKARKALTKLIEEISPKFLSVVFDEMKSQLTKGFQQHVYLFSLHALLSGLAANGQLKPGAISSHTIDINMDILLSELFGDLD